MADNVVLNAGTGGATLATDEVTRATVVQHVQYVKLMSGTDGAIDVLPGDATNGLDVDVTRLPALVAGDNNIGNVDVVTLPALPAGTNNIGDVDVVTLPALAAGTNNIGDVDVATVPAPLSTTGGGTEATALRVTLASDSTGLVSIDDNGGSITVDGAVSLAAALPAGTNNIGDVDVLTLPALPAGTNNIGDVDVLSVIPGTSATSLGKAEDAAHTTGDTGVMALAVRFDAGGALAGTDGDYSPLQVDASGALRVTGGGGGTEYSEDVATPATIVGTATMMERDDALSALTPIEGDWAAMRCSANGALWVAVDGSVTVDLGVNNDVTVTGTVTANLAAGTNNIGDVDVLSIAAGDNNIGNVDIVTMPNVTLAAGTNTNEFVGDAAHDAAIAGNPVRIGARGLSADYAAVATGDTADLIASLLGKLVTLSYALPGATESYASPAAVTDTADDVAFAAAGAGIRHYITGAQVFNGHDTVGTEVVIKDGTTVLWRGWAEQAGGGCSARFDPPLRGTANTAVNVANITTGSATYFNLQGYKAAE